MLEKQTAGGRTTKNKSFLRTLLITVGCLFGALVLAAIVVPLVVDVDKYRPAIVSKANESINGKIELGKLGLSLWGRIKVDVDGLKVSDSAGRQVVAVKDVSLNLPLLPLITGHPSVRLAMSNPAIELVKQRDGKLNAMTLMKAAPAGSAAGTPGARAAGGAKAAPAGVPEVPSIVLNSRITILLDHARLAYKDETTGDTYNVNDLNFRLQDVSPSGNMPFEISATLDMLMQKKIKVTGPVSFSGDVKASSGGGSFEKAEAHASIKLDDLEIVDPGTLDKKKGVPLGAELTATVEKDGFKVPSMKFRLAGVTIGGEASGKTAAGVTTIDFKAQSNQIDVAKLGDLSPMVKEYGLNGIIELAVSASGPTDKLGYGAKVKFGRITLSNAALKQPIEVNGQIAVATDRIEDLSVKLGARDFDLELKGMMQGFMTPHFKFSLASSGMDLDGLLKASEKAAQARKEQAAAPAGGSSAAGAAPVVDYNAMFTPLRENPIAAAAVGTLDFSIKRMKSTGVVIDDLKGELQLDRLMMALKGFSMRIFDGGIQGAMSFNARSAKPVVATNLTVSGLQTEKMVASQMPIAKNTVKGIISASLNIGGPGLNQSDINTAWKGSGSFDIKNAVISTLDVGRELKDGVIAKLPEVARSKVKVPDSVLAQKGEYEVIGTKFAMNDGVVHVNEISGKAYPNKGMDLKGAGTIKLADYGLDMNLDAIDTYNMIPEVNQRAPDPRYHHFAASAHVTNTLFSPKFDWGSTVTKLAQNWLKGEGMARAKQILGDKAAGGLLNKIPGLGGGGGGDNKPAPKPQDMLKGLFGH